MVNVRAWVSSVDIDLVLSVCDCDTDDVIVRDTKVSVLSSVSDSVNVTDRTCGLREADAWAVDEALLVELAFVSVGAPVIVAEADCSGEGPDAVRDNDRCDVGLAVAVGTSRDGLVDTLRVFWGLVVDAVEVPRAGLHVPRSSVDEPAIVVVKRVATFVNDSELVCVGLDRLHVCPPPLRRHFTSVCPNVFDWVGEAMLRVWLGRLRDVDLLKSAVTVSTLSEMDAVRSDIVCLCDRVSDATPNDTVADERW